MDSPKQRMFSTSGQIIKLPQVYQLLESDIFHCFTVFGQQVPHSLSVRLESLCSVVHYPI